MNADSRAEAPKTSTKNDSNQEKQKRLERFAREELELTSKRGFQLVSRVLGMDAQPPPELDLRIPKVQETFYDDYILPHRMSMMSLDDTNPKMLVPELRKLREGVLSSGRMDGFCITVYEASCDLAIEAEEWPEFLKSASHLVSNVYPIMGKAGQGRLLTRSCIYVKYLLLYLACQGDTKTVYKVYKSLPIPIRKDFRVLDAMKVMKSLANNHYTQFAKYWHEANDIERQLLQLGLTRYRQHLIKTLVKVFHKLPRDYLLYLLCATREDDLSLLHPSLRTLDNQSISFR
jgi:hypothetical protein